jgi:hypothetical protein
MAEQSENMKQMQTVVDNVNRCLKLLREYEVGKFTLTTGAQVDIPAAQVTELKAAFAAARTGGKAAWDAVTA